MGYISKYLKLGFFSCFLIAFPMTCFSTDFKNPGPYFEIGKYWTFYVVNMMNGERMGGVTAQVVEQTEFNGKNTFILFVVPIQPNNIDPYTIYQTEEDGLVYQYSEPRGEWLPIVDFNVEPGYHFPESDLWVENVETIEFMGFRRKLVRLGNHFYWSIGDYWLDGVGALGGITLSGPFDVVPHVYTLIQECGKGEEVYFNLDEFYTYMGWASTPALQASEENLSEYFTLEGIRVAEPQPGQLLIRRQGAKADKVIL